MLFSLSKEDFNNLVINSANNVIVEFYSDTCRSCQQLEIILEDLSDDLYDTHKIFKINAHEQIDIADNYDVFTLPTLLLFQQGKLVSSLSGLQSLKTIKNWLNI